MSKVVKYYYTSPLEKVIAIVNFGSDEIVCTRRHRCKRYTIAAIYDDDDHTIKFGLATCQPVDNFCKAVGRKIAEQNAITKPFHVINNFTGRRNDFADNVIAIMIEKERKLLKKDNLRLFNNKNIIE